MGFVAGFLAFLSIIIMIVVLLYLNTQIRELNNEQNKKLNNLSKSLNLSMTNAAAVDSQQQSAINNLASSNVTYMKELNDLKKMVVDDSGSTFIIPSEDKQNVFIGADTVLPV